jgi:hypothetical protein
MFEGRTWTCIFYVFVSCAALAPLWLIWDFGHRARTQGYGWTLEANRDMYANEVKTTLTASGTAVALVASNYSAGRASNIMRRLAAVGAAVSCFTSVVH